MGQGGHHNSEPREFLLMLGDLPGPSRIRGAREPWIVKLSGPTVSDEEPSVEPLLSPLTIQLRWAGAKKLFPEVRGLPQRDFGRDVRGSRSGSSESTSIPYRYLAWNTRHTSPGCLKSCLRPTSISRQASPLYLPPSDKSNVMFCPVSHIKHKHTQMRAMEGL